MAVVINAELRLLIQGRINLLVIFDLETFVMIDSTPEKRKKRN